MATSTDVIAGNGVETAHRADFSSDEFEAQLAETIANGNASAIAALCLDVSRCPEALRRLQITDRLIAAAPLGRVAADGTPSEIRCVLNAAHYSGSADQRTRIVDVLTAPGPLGRVAEAGTAAEIAMTAAATWHYASEAQGARIVATLTASAPLGRLIADETEASIGLLAEAADRWAEPGELLRIADAVTAAPTLARIVERAGGVAVSRVACLARHASAPQRTRIVDALTAPAPLARVAVCQDPHFIDMALQAALHHASPDQITRIVDALTADAPLERVVAERRPQQIEGFLNAALAHGSIGERWRVIPALAPAAFLPLEVAMVYANAGEILPAAVRQGWAAGAAALDGHDTTSLAVLMRRMALEAAGARGGADTVARRMLPTVQALGEKPEVIPQAAKYATDRPGCVNQPEVTWSEMAAAVPLLCEFASTPLQIHRCLQAAGILHARQQVDLMIAVMSRERGPDGRRWVPENLEVEFAGLVLARVNERLHPEQRLPGVALEGQVAYTGELSDAAYMHLRNVAVLATGAAQEATQPAEAARYLLESRYAALWQEKLQERFPVEYAQVDARATALLAHPQIEGNDDAMVAVGHWREVRRSEVTAQLTPGHERDAQLPTLEAVEALLINFLAAGRRAVTPGRMPAELPVPAALRALRIALDAPPLVPPRTPGAGVAARPALHWAAMPPGPHSRSPAPPVAPRRSPQGGRGL